MRTLLRLLTAVGLTAAGMAATGALTGSAYAAGTCTGPAALADRAWTFTSPTGVVTTRPALNGAIIPGGGTATVTFHVAAGCSSVPFVIASYLDPVRGYTESTASQQVLFDSAAGVFSADGLAHSLTVSLPSSARTDACPNKHPAQTGTGSGANGWGYYFSTCDGSPSLNGNGNGNSSKPCAGCVGNADNKNPPGQAPNGSDPNAGYECDRNNGVGKSNPAHTGCVFSQLDFATGPLIANLGPSGSGNAYGDGGQFIEAAFGAP
ncbi:MAG: hypothetical protein QOG99_2818 [Frankiales bacterium]|nr:hypothetical protein [Frankiales bacterium]